MSAKSVQLSQIQGEVPELTAHTSKMHSFCCANAAATSSARIDLYLDTVILAVSILILLGARILSGS
jgi:hypothetical protein